MVVIIDFWGSFWADSSECLNSFIALQLHNICLLIKLTLAVSCLGRILIPLNLKTEKTHYYDLHLSYQINKLGEIFLKNCFREVINSIWSIFFLHKDFFLSKEEDFYILWSLTVMKNKLFIDCSTREIKIKKENPVFVSLMSVQHFQRGCYVLINSKWWQA